MRLNRASLGKGASTRSGNTEAPISTTSEVFSDAVIEVTREPAKADAWKLVLWKKKSFQQGTRVEHGGRSYEPVTLNSRLAKAIALPTRVRRYHSTRVLFEDMVAFVSSSADLSPKAARLASYWVLASWFWDVVPTAPCLLITGPKDEALWLLRALAAVSYHSLLLGHLTPASFRSLPADLHLTLVVDQRQLTPSMARLILASNNRGCVIPRSGDVWDPYCSKAIYVADGTLAMLADANLQVAVMPSDGSKPADRTQRLKSKAAKLRDQLLYFRLTNRPRIATIPNFDDCDLTPPIRALAGVLTVGIIDDPKLRREIVPLLQPQDKYIRAEQALSLDSSIVEALVVFCHEGKRRALRVQEITETTNSIRHGRGETLDLSPEEIGISLNRRLGLFTRRTGAGKRLVLDAETQAMVHELGYRYRVPSLEGGKIRCRHCRRRLAAYKDVPVHVM